MSKKLQSYYIFKFESDRLKRCNNKVENLSINEARKNGEVVSLGDSEVLRLLRKLKKINIDQKEIDALFVEKKRLKYKINTEQNKERIRQIENKIDEYLFVQEIISIVIKDHRHYLKIVNDGLIINGKEYVRFLCGAGNARRSTVFMVQKQWEERLRKTLDNNRNESVAIVPAKYNAYFALANSATMPVSTPRFCVIADYLPEQQKDVLFIEQRGNEDFVIEKRTITHKANVFDGQGLISPKQSALWAKELELNHIPSAFCIRGPFMKGMVCTFDFHKFGRVVANKKVITDVWGNNVNLDDVDVIITTSQLKLWDSYTSFDEYLNSCNSNELGWGISRYTPKKENDYVFTNYQFLQVLNLDDDQIESLCKKTLNYFYNVGGGDIRHVVLYLLGKSVEEDLTEGFLEKISDPITKSLLYNNELVHDPYIKQTVCHTLNKKIKESYMGNLIVDGNYQVIISDPYAMAEHVYGIPVKGLLANKQHYSRYWNNKGVDTVSGLRAPLTWRSENNILHLQKNSLTEEWYEHIDSGIIFNIHGNDCLLLGGSDFDYDILCTTSSKEFIDGAYGGLPVTYKEQKAEKVVIDHSALHLSDIQSMSNKIGFLTNCSTTLYSMMDIYPKDSIQYQEIYNRAIVCRLHQGFQIDKSKGLVVPDIPQHWTKFTRPTQDMDDKERERIEFNNSILIDKRPYFMRYLYAHYDKKYQQHKEIYDMITVAKFGYDVDTLVKKKNHTEEEKKVLDTYNERGFFINTACVMNKICWHMEKSIKESRAKLSKTNDNVTNILINKNIPIDPDKVKQMEKLFLEYKNNKKDVHEQGSALHLPLAQFIIYVRQKANEISSNESELANLAVSVCYANGSSKSKDFVWQVFGDGVVQNVMMNSNGPVRVPVLDDDGDVEFLGKKYRFLEVNTKDD